MSPRKDTRVDGNINPIFGVDTDELFLLRKLWSVCIRDASDDGVSEDVLDILDDLKKLKRKKKS